MEPSKSNNTETEEETIAFNRKRARRVSFADNEITSVHIFRPDDDHSSSSDEIPAETLDLFRQLVAESDDEEPDRRRNSTDGEGEAVDHRNSFLQPIGSPSPGGSSINADDETDDDEFGGPVSMDFIKPGRLSDSGVSDDITMDSTAFSMHYRSLARSDSGDLKTPTRFEATVSTPGLSSATPGSFMELTDREKRVPQSPVVASASEDSDAMSIEGEQPKTYDYVRLSPGLVAILAQGSKDLDGVSPLGSKATHPPIAVAFGSSTKSPLTKTGIEVSSGKKRKGVQLLSNGDDIEKTGRIDRSQEVHKSGDGDLQFVLEQTSMRSEREKFGDQKWNDFDHVLERFSTSTKQLLSPSFDKLNFRLMGTLEDILVRLQKVKKWDILSSEIHSQKKLTDPLDIPRHKRVVEMKLLLFNIAYEKAKLQLMNVKRERLLEKVQQLSSGLQETQMMKNSMPCSAKTRLVDIQADDSHINTKIFNSQGKCQVSCKNVMETRQELENLDQKAKSLSEFFYSYCKMKGDQSYTNVVRSVRDYLEKRISYKLVFQNLKLWDVEDFERKDDYHMIILNYRGYIIQRFTVNAGLSSIIVSNSLNDVNIGKTYPNMDAFSAFVFALNPHTTSKCMGRISMAQETQITGSLLSNLLDVVEEVQLARVEIRNLVQAKFNSHSVNQLDLQLSFIDFCGGKKVQVILDMTCLK
ncbi:unnamed protein product [Trifolium pratense]|nr:unnamed protein product [Trifolium pratense]